MPKIPRATRAISLRRRGRLALAPLAAAAGALLLPTAQATDYGWTGGNLSTQVFAGGININDTLSIACPPGFCSGKYVDQSFSSSASVTASDTLYFQYAGNSFSNGWRYDFQGDVGLINTYAGGGFVNEAGGVMVKTAGSGDSTISISVTSRGGSILDALSGGFAFTGGSASFDSGAILKANTGTHIAFTGGSASFAAGVKFYGDGLYQIGTNASFGGDVGAASWAFTNGSYTGGDGSAGSHATLVTDASWTGNGALQGSWVLNAGTTLSALGGGTRYIRGSVVNAGTLRSDSSFYFEYPSYSISNSGRLELQGDGGLINTYGGGTLVNTGTLAKTAGTGTSSISGMSVSNSGVIDVQTGTLQFSGGSLDFTDGTRFTGAGTALLSSRARLSGRIDSQNLVLAGANYEGGDGGTHPLAELHGSTRWTGGSLTGQWQLDADHTLSVDGGGTHHVRGSVVNGGRILASDNLYFEYASYVLDNRGTLDLQADAGLFNIYSGGTLLNSGSLLKSGGSGTSVVSGITSSFAGGSLLWVQSGSLNFSSASTGFTSGAVLRVNAGSELLFSGGQTTFADGVTLQGAGAYTVAGNSQVQGAISAQHLTLGAGSHTGGDGSAGSMATLNSDAVWTGNGGLQGSWTVAAGTTLSVQGDGTRYIRGAISNLGTLRSDGPLYFEYPSYSISNSGRLELQGDVGLINTYSGGTLVNSGTLAKTAGTGTSSISGINFSNSGRIDVPAGTLQFSGGTLDFTDGTQLTGAGAVLVSSDARFAGRIDTQNLVLAGAGYAGGNGGAQPSAELHGSTHWSGGWLTGQWTLAADHTLAVDVAGNRHYVRGSITNLGLIQASDNLYFEYPSYSITNQGSLNLVGDVGLLTTYAGGTLVNTGLLLKSAGAGESSLASISVLNTGTIDVQTGTLRLPGNFTNNGLLMGRGRIASAGTLNNAGRIAPGASSGTLTLDSHLTLDAAGTLAIELQDLTQHDLLVVNGNVTLGGELALSCHSPCSFAAGSDILVLDASGSLSGAFDSVSLAGFTAGQLSIFVDDAQADVWVHVNQDISAAVPEPETWGLMLGGLGVVLLLALRRRGDPD